MDADQLLAFSTTARRFRQREVAPLLEQDSRDGDMVSIGSALQQAASIGLLATPDPESPGHAFGVWGEASIDAGPQSSLSILEEVSIGCAGVAACLHAAGSAVTELVGIVPRYSNIAVALFDREWTVTWEALTTPPANAAAIADRGNALVLDGATSFVLAPPGCEAFIVYAARNERWERVLVPTGAPGLKVVDVGPRTGLAAVDVVHLSFEGVHITAPDTMLGPRDPHGVVRRFMLGLSALAVGNATGALYAARQYARERYQGGELIERHPAIQLLLGDSGARVAACSAALTDVARRDENDPAATWRAFAIKLRTTLECEQVVSDCLQILGGYGYMEDYRLEKRLRDAMTLKSMGLSPNTLRRLCAETFYQPVRGL